ncbi:MAG: non-canonical purine NTP pyrophosphatase [Bacilli bacterium]|nr:non-canonical purine NTP pyrophosphatase [Bacilli bacterium]
MQKITLVTGNWAKLLNTKNKLKPYGIDVDNIKMETVEIQADTAEEVAAYSAKYAADLLKKDVLKIDSGLYVDCLNGFPGPYTHYCEDTIGNKCLLKMMKGEKNRKAELREALAYCKPGEEPVIFSSTTKGTIALRESGKFGWSWDFVFIPDGKDVTLGHFEDDERMSLWDDTAYNQLGEYLKNNFDK